MQCVGDDHTACKKAVGYNHYNAHAIGKPGGMSKCLYGSLQTITTLRMSNLLGPIQTQLCFAALNGLVQVQLEAAPDLPFRRGQDYW